ncbi:MAG: ferredoxin [Desulfurococcales archaeon]|nr:ferredoxin [Desulfurococcales archaeon]MCE4605067.1 ferredoxin [Desulfurococcales archaeon]
MRVLIEPREACILCMVCVAICPEVFSIRGDKILVSGTPWRGEAPRDMEPCIEAASSNCPVDIIVLEQDNDEEAPSGG